MAKKISQENSCGSIMDELRYYKEEELFSPHSLFDRWSTADLSTLFRDPFGELKYLRDLSSKNAKKRKKALKVAEEFRAVMHEVFQYIFGAMLNNVQREELVAFCETTANGMLSSLVAGADREVQLNATVRGRKYYVERLIGKPVS